MFVVSPQKVKTKADITGRVKYLVEEASELARETFRDHPFLTISSLALALYVSYGLLNEKMVVVNRHFVLTGVIGFDASPMVSESLRKAGAIITPFWGKKLNVGVRLYQSNEEFPDEPEVVPLARINMGLTDGGGCSIAHRVSESGGPLKRRELQELIRKAALCAVRAEQEANRFRPFKFYNPSLGREVSPFDP